MGKRIIYTTLIVGLFIFGVAVGFYKIFPLPEILAWKQSVEYKPGIFERQQYGDSATAVVTDNTFLQRLLIKKVLIPQFNRSGGAISTSGNLLYYISSKGSVQIFNLDRYFTVANNIPVVPMNIIGLVRSAHLYKNDFHMSWFRVNGAYVENLNSQADILFVSHNAYNAQNDCITQNISRIKLHTGQRSVSKIGNWKAIFTSSPCIKIATEKMQSPILYNGNISGGNMINYNKNKLLVTVGDYNQNGLYGTDIWDMNPANPYGKFILVDKKTGRWSVFTEGNRNATGVLIDKDFTIWAVENGPEGGDELNILTKGSNYGWPMVSYGLWYDHKLALPGNQKRGTHPEYQKPVFSWVPSIAPRGLIKIEGSKFDQWHGDLIVGTMRDESLHRLRLDQNNRVVYDERIPINYRVRDLTTLPDGKIAMITDDGYLVIIGDGGPSFRDINANVRHRIAALQNFDRFTPKRQEPVPRLYEHSARFIVQEKCLTCHNLSAGIRVGPPLNALLGRKIGSVKNFNYSRTLEADPRFWNAKLLHSFLTDPDKDFPGTQMSKVNLSPAEVDSLIKFFKNQKAAQ